MNQTQQTVILIRERESEDAKWVDLFTVENSTYPEQNLRAAVNEHLLTEEGEKEIKETNYGYNWGDAVNYVPHEIWKKHGVTPIYNGDTLVVSNLTEVIVDQDESLVPEELLNKENV